MQLEPLDLSHAQDMADLHREGFSRAWSADEFKKLLDSPARRALGLKSAQGAGISAFALFSLVLDEAEIITLVSAKNQRRQGLGRVLLALSLKALEAEGMEKCFLDVAEDNHPAVNLYISCGFVISGRRKGYYDGVDALLMTYETTRSL